MQPDRINDREHWARLHIISDRSKPVDLPDRPLRPNIVFSMWPSHRKPKGE